VIGLGIGSYASAWLGIDREPPTVAKPIPPVESVEQPTESATAYVSAANFIFQDRPVPVPDLTFLDSSGEAHKLSDFRGRAVVLNLWAIWCVPCRWELPSLDRLQTEFDRDKLMVIPLSGDDASEVQRFYYNNGVTSLGTYTTTAGGLIIKFGFSGFPGTVLIDADGNEVGRKIGPLEWDDKGVIDTLRQHFGLPVANAVENNT
jgi:thiol-disulfide isomerase/thioredoxin